MPYKSYLRIIPLLQGHTIDRNPIIGPHPLKQNQWLCLGYTGNGMPKCVGAGKAIADMIDKMLEVEKFPACLSPSRFLKVDQSTN